MKSAAMVFSHPNHEIAVLGTIFRLRPHIIYLTDGGGEARVEQTKKALEVYQPASVHYLNHSEPSLYQALLEGDSNFYCTLAREVENIVRSLEPATVYCDAVEFYNPVHDMALPVVRSALSRNGASILEIPLIYQKKGGINGFELQRVPESLSSQTICVELSEEELNRKIATIESGVYGMLFAQLGDAITNAVPSLRNREYFLRARNNLPLPAPEQVLRYEMRGRALKEAGTVQNVITFDEHYVPVFKALCETN